MFCTSLQRWLWNLLHALSWVFLCKCHKASDYRGRGFLGESHLLPTFIGYVANPSLIKSSLAPGFKYWNRHIYLLNHCQIWGFYLFVSCGKGGFQIILVLRGNWKQDLFLVLIWLLKMDQWKPVITLIYLKMYYVHFAKMLRGKSFAFTVVWPEARILHEAVWKSQNIIIHVFLCIQYNSLARQSVPFLKYI